MSEPSATIEVEVVFALPEIQQLHCVTVPQGTTAAEAVGHAGLMQQWRLNPDAPLPLARFGRLIKPETVLATGDRVEILRPLLADPKDQRRQRVRDKAKASARARSVRQAS